VDCGAIHTGMHCSRSWSVRDEVLQTCFHGETLVFSVLVVGLVASCLSVRSSPAMCVQKQAPSRSGVACRARGRGVCGGPTPLTSQTSSGNAGQWKLSSSFTACNLFCILSHALFAPSYVLLRCPVLLHTLTGISPSSQFIVSSRSISQSGLLSANSYLLSTLASTTVCSR
jgi:hypothetical protein